MVLRCLTVSTYSAVFEMYDQFLLDELANPLGIDLLEL